MVTKVLDFPAEVVAPSQGCHAADKLVIVGIAEQSLDVIHHLVGEKLSLDMVKLLATFLEGLHVGAYSLGVEIDNGEGNVLEPVSGGVEFQI